MVDFIISSGNMLAILHNHHHQCKVWSRERSVDQGPPWGVRKGGPFSYCKKMPYIEEFFFRVVFPRKSQWNAGPVMFNSLKEKSDQTDCQDDHHDQKQVGRKENGPAVHLRRSQSFWNFFLTFWFMEIYFWQRVSCQWAVEYLIIISIWWQRCRRQWG